MADPLKIIKRLAHERDNLVKLLECCEAREVQWRKLRGLVIKIAHTHGVCWCAFGIGHPLYKKHTDLCDEMYRAVYGGERK